MTENRRKEIGRRIEKLRVEKLNGISQVKLGKAIGTTGQNMGLVIRGQGSLSLERAIYLCDFAGVTMDYLYRGIPMPEEPVYRSYKKRNIKSH